MNDNADDLIFSISEDKSALRRSIQRIEQSFDGLSGSVARKFASVGRSIDSSVSSTVQQRINAMTGIGTKAAKEWTGALADQGKELDRLRAKYSPIFSVISNYKTAVGEIRRAHALGAISSTEYQAAMSKERQAALAATAAIKGRNQAIATAAPSSSGGHANDNSLSEGNRRFLARDIAFQGQDIITTAVGGMSPKMIALQQGTQIAGAVQGLTLKETGSVLAGAVTNLLNPIALASIAFTGLTAAGIQFFAKAKDGALSLDDALKANAEALDRIHDKYGELSKVPTSLTSVAGNSFVLSDARTKQIAIQATLRNQLGGYLGATNDTSLTSYVASANSLENVKTLQNLPGELAKFSGPVRALLDGVKDGRTELDGFNSQIEDLYTTLSKSTDDVQTLRNSADAVKALADAAFSVSGRFKPFQDAINILKVQGIDGLAAFADEVHRIGEEKGIAKLADELISKGGDIVKLAQEAETLRRALQAIDREDTRPGLRDRDQLEGYVARRAASLRQLNEQFAADQQQQNARTFSERLAAAERVSRADRPQQADEGGGADARAARAVEAERNRQTRELRDAALSRSRGLQSSIEDQQQEIALIGKSSAEQAVLRKQYELTSQIRQEAIANGIEAEGRFDEVYGKEIASIKALSAQYGELSDMLAKVKLNQDLADQARLSTLSKQDQQIVTTLRQYGLDDKDLGSPQAQQIRKQLVANDNRETITSFLTEFKDGIVKNGDSIGKAFGSALQNALMKQADKLWDNLFNQIANLLLGTKADSGSTAGGGIVGAGVKAAGKLFSSPSVTGAAASQTTQTGVAAQAWNFFADKGLQPHQIAGILGNMSAESAFNPLAKGDQGKALGLFQWNDRAPKMLSAIGGRQNLGDVNSQLNYAWSELQGPENRAFQALMKSTDVRGATAAFAGFERPKGFSWANPEDAHNFSGRLDAANDALSKFGSTTTQATQGVGALGNGLGQLGNSLSGGASSGGGGGILGWLGNLFRGGGQFKAAQAGLLKPGLFADGGHVAGPGTSRSDSVPAWLSNGEFVVNAQATRKHRTMLEAINNGSIARFADGGLVAPRMVSTPVAPSLTPRLAAAGNDNRQPGILQVQISGASGDDHVRMLVRQGVGEGLQTYNKQQERSGFGAVQARYTSQKV